jgi:hypothetical protein
MTAFFAGYGLRRKYETTEVSMSAEFTPGNNIAMKVPVHEFDRTVAFYRDVLGFEEIEASSPDDIESVTFKFGDKNLWIDKNRRSQSSRDMVGGCHERY